MAEVIDDAVTIDELARRTGMTVRNIRAYQSRGLLPPPQVRGRTGYYATEHLTRIQLIRELQAEGFNLESIRRLIDAGGGASNEEVLRFTQELRAPFEDEEPEIVNAEELARKVGGGPPDPELLRRTVKLGLLRPLGDDRFEILSPRLIRAAEELTALGITPQRALSIASRIRRHAEGVARAFVELFLQEVWEPFEEAGRPPERWAEVRSALERLRPLAAESLLGIFQLAMSDAVDSAFGREIVRMSSDHDKRSRRRRRR